MTWRLAAFVVAGALAFGCTSSTDDSAGQAAAVDDNAGPLVAPASAEAYTFELISSGEDPRQALVALMPVGRQARVSVSLMSLDETVDVTLEATVEQAGADGKSQLIELVVLAVTAEDGAPVVGLQDIVGSSSRLVRDERLAVVEQEFALPPELSFRSDAVARQALRAPFALIGPLPLVPVGAGASWVVETMLEGRGTERVEVDVVANSDAEFELRFAIANGVVEVTGQAGELLPTEQVITLDNATVRVRSERSDGNGG